MTKLQVEAPVPYSGYLRRAETSENAELTHVDKGTPGGEYLRRYWQPVALAAELRDVPLAVDLLGEKLVLFRDKSGTLGLLDRACSHRAMSLEFGLIREHGIQCAYHGWHYNTDGRILDIPGAPDAATYKDAFCQGAYPVRDYRGIVFAYLGPPDRIPVFPVYDFMELPDQELVPVCWHSPANWVQVRENTQDPMHLSFLHAMFGNAQFGAWSYDIPVMQWTETPIGQITVVARHTHGHLYARVNELILPNFSRVPDIPPFGSTTRDMSDRGRGMSLWVVPRDNVNSIMIGWFHLTGDMDEAWRREYMAMFSLGQSCDRPYAERQRNPGDWDAWTSQGRIAIHANEHLCQNDGGVAMFRVQLRKGISAVQSGADPKGLIRKNAGPVRSYGCNLAEACHSDDPPGTDELKSFAAQVLQQVLDREPAAPLSAVEVELSK